MRLFKKIKLTEIYEEDKLRVNLSDLIPENKQKYKSQILDFFTETIQNSDSNRLEFYISVSFNDGIDSDYIEHFEKLILADWHEQHEDIVDIIYQFKDDRFSNALNEIALNQSKYRQYDDENESTLRKCIHALKAIDSEKSNEILNSLMKMKNRNIDFTLEMYED